jgi:predicted enzyme related to lactoylglutathione lyase
MLRSAFAVFFALAGAAPVFADQAPAPAIAQPGAAEHHPGKVVFVELVTPDLSAAEHFYGGLFGWTFRDFQVGPTGYSEAYLDGRMVAGMVQKTVPLGEPKRPSWLTFIAAKDVDAVEKIALRHGGKVLREAHDIPNRGRQAVLSDPQGAVFAVLASSSGDTPDELADPGEWIWSSLLTSDPDNGAAFYQDLFDYEVFEADSPDKGEHLTLATENYARASANPLPGGNPNMHPHWLNYIRVEDAAATAQKVVAMGGRVLLAPRTDRHGGKIAIVADPSGAPFGLMEWSQTQGEGTAK